MVENLSEKLPKVTNSDRNGQKKIARVAKGGIQVAKSTQKQLKAVKNSQGKQEAAKKKWPKVARTGLIK